MSRPKVCTVLSLTLLVACVAEQAAPPDVAMPQWTVAREPDLSIGGVEVGADPLYQVGGAVRTETGYAISNRSADEVRFYDGNGRLMGRAGRDGSGPREFRNPSIIGVLNEDSIVVYDGGNKRISIICPEQEICAERPIRHPAPVIGVERNYAVMTNEVFGAPSMLGGRAAGFYVITLDRTTSTVDTLRVLDAMPRHIADGADNTTYVIGLPMMRPPQVAVSREGILVANGRDPILELISFAGAEMGTIEVPIEPQPVTEAGFRAEARARLGAIIDADPAVADVIDEMDRPLHRAPIRRLLVDRTDLVWIERDQADVDLHEWIVVDTEGGVRAAVTTPAGVEVLDIGEDYVLGLAHDSLDVEYVRRYALSRH